MIKADYIAIGTLRLTFQQEQGGNQFYLYQWYDISWR